MSLIKKSVQTFNHETWDATTKLHHHKALYTAVQFWCHSAHNGMNEEHGDEDVTQINSL